MNWTIGIIINQVSTCLLAFSFLTVASVYNSLRNKAPEGRGKQIYKNLFLAWLCFSLTYIITFLRNLFPIVRPTIHIWLYRIDVVVSAVGGLFLFSFIGLIYHSERIKKVYTFFGIIITLAIFFLYLGWNIFIPTSSMFTTRVSRYGVEVIPPTVIRTMLFLLILTMISVFALTILIFNLKRVKPKIKRKVMKVNSSYILYWVWTLFEGAGTLTALLGGLGMIITRILLMSTGFLTILMWTGRKRFVKVIKAFF